MSIADEYVSPRMRQLLKRAYLGVLVGAPLAFLFDRLGFKPGFVVCVAVLLPSFVVAWVLTLWLFVDATLGDYMRFRRSHRERQHRAQRAVDDEDGDS